MAVKVNIYYISLFVLLPMTVLLMIRNILLGCIRRFLARRKARKDPNYNAENDQSNEKDLDPEVIKDHEARAFQIKFLKVYLLAMAADWLQGPYTYPLLKTEFDYGERTVAMLYMTTFISAAICSLFVGFLADKFGRRKAGLAFCVIHSLSALTVFVPNIHVLFVGQALGGLGLAMLWTVFESWMVTEWNTRELGDERLGTMFGIMVRANCSAAVVGGILGDFVVRTFKSKKGPFAAGVVFEVIAAVMMMLTWNENYGQPKDTNTEDRQTTKQALKQLGDIKLWALSFISCCWEGTNFLVNFFWAGILQDAHDITIDKGPDYDDVPYGPVFAVFMLFMILGSLLFSAIVKRTMDKATPQPLWKRIVTAPQNLLGIVIFFGGASLVLCVNVSIEIVIFIGFLLFEFCNGIYVPSVAYQRGLIVNEGNRAGLYGLMKLPHYVFVIVALATAVEDHSHRKIVILACFSALVLAALASFFGLRRSPASSQKGAIDLEQVEDISDDGSSLADTVSVTEKKLLVKSTTFGKN
ncbi:hypothetical protein QBC35DRAFT_472638 [Podospora australis]|uniref:Molybdate-anion transporter n=1 Tax=Podospora australis TaxID=1536484 RepID=A0AAN6X0Q7_9PEZI|nr:hypothetical protein QBC35DRAFT_472638 [Podospora australis]